MQPSLLPWELVDHVPAVLNLGGAVDDDGMNDLSSVRLPEGFHVWVKGIFNEDSGIVIIVTDGEFNTNGQSYNN